MVRSLWLGSAWVGVVLGVLSAPGCGDIFGVACEGMQRPNLDVEVRDSATGQPLAYGATGVAEHQSGRVTDLLSGGDPLHLYGSWQREQPGTYAVEVRKPGYAPVREVVRVDDGKCHVKTPTVQLALSPRPGSGFRTPLSFRHGEHVEGGGGSAGVTMHADTLVVTGRAYAPCTQLTAVAYRRGNELHVQLEPEEWEVDLCREAAVLQQYEVRYLLPGGSTVLYVANGRYRPAFLCSGSVQVPE